MVLLGRLEWGTEKTQLPLQGTYQLGDKQGDLEHVAFMWTAVVWVFDNCLQRSKCPLPCADSKSGCSVWTIFAYAALVKGTVLGFKNLK